MEDLQFEALQAQIMELTTKLIKTETAFASFQLAFYRFLKTTNPNLVTNFEDELKHQYNSKLSQTVKDYQYIPDSSKGHLVEILKIK